MGGEEEFFDEPAALTKLCTDEYERKLRKCAPVVKKVLMHHSEESNPLKMILICPHQPEERI
jgi:hypothetical protein